MQLQSLIERSIQHAALTTNTVFFHTHEAEGYGKLWDEYLEHSLILNGDCEHATQHYNCSACREFIQRAGRFVYFDQVPDTSEVRLRSLLWEPGNLDQLKPELAMAIERLRAVTLGNGMVSNAKAYSPEPMGWARKGQRTPDTEWEHLHLQPLPVAPTSLHPNEIEQRVSRLKKVAGEYLRYGLPDLKDTLAPALADTKISENIKAKFKLLVSHLEMVIQVDTNAKVNHIRWLIASNPALVELCKFYGTPAGQFISALLDGKKSYESSRSAMLTQYDALNYQRTDKKSTDDVSELQLLEADRLLMELGLNESLERRVLGHRDLGLFELTWQPTDITKSEVAKGTMCSLKTPEVKEPTVVESEPMGIQQFLASLDTYAKVSIELTDNWCAIHLYSEQVNRDRPSVLRTGEYINHFNFNRAPTSAYTKDRVAEVIGVTKVDTATCLLLKSEFKHTGQDIPTPLFPAAADARLHGIRKQLEVWANATPTTCPSDTLLGLGLYEGLEQYQPVVHVVKHGEPQVVRRVKLVMK